MSTGSNGRCAFVVINGLQMLQCVLPSPSERTCCVFADAIDNLRVMHDRGKVELSCLLYSSCDVVEDRRPWIVTLTADDEAISLGRVPRTGSRAVVVCRYLGRHPRSFALKVTFDESSVVSHPEEELFLEDVRNVLANENLRCSEGGFVSLSYLQNKLEGLEIYKRVIGAGKSEGHYHKNLCSFVASHSNILQLRQVPGGESQVALVPDQASRSWTAVECQRRRDNEAEDDRRAVLEVCALLSNGPVDAQTLLPQLRASAPVFCRRFRASNSSVVSFFELHSDKFWWCYDPVHTTRVGLRSESD